MARVSADAADYHASVNCGTPCVAAEAGRPAARLELRGGVDLLGPQDSARAPAHARRVRHQAAVSVSALSSGVGRRPNARSIFEESTTNGSSNS